MSDDDVKRILHSLGRVEAGIDHLKETNTGQNARLKDHEQRINILEQFKSKALVYIGLISAGIGILMNIFIKGFFLDKQ